MRTTRGNGRKRIAPNRPTEIKSELSDINVGVIGAVQNKVKDQIHNKIDVIAADGGTFCETSEYSISSEQLSYASFEGSAESNISENAFLSLLDPKVNINIILCHLSWLVNILGRADLGATAVLGLVSAVAVLAIGVFSSFPPIVEYEVQLVFSVFLATILLWIAKPVPYAISSILIARIIRKRQFASVGCIRKVGSSIAIATVMRIVDIIDPSCRRWNDPSVLFLVLRTVMTSESTLYRRLILASRRRRGRRSGSLKRTKSTTFAVVTSVL